MTDTSNITMNHLPYKKIRKYSMINSIDNKKIYLDEINLERQDNFNINSLELWNKKYDKYDVKEEGDDIGKNDNSSKKIKKKKLMMITTDDNICIDDEYALYKRYKMLMDTTITTTLSSSSTSSNNISKTTAAINNDNDNSNNQVNISSSNISNKKIDYYLEAQKAIYEVINLVELTNHIKTNQSFTIINTNLDYDDDNNQRQQQQQPHDNDNQYNHRLPLIQSLYIYQQRYLKLYSNITIINNKMKSKVIQHHQQLIHDIILLKKSWNVIYIDKNKKQHINNRWFSIEKGDIIAIDCTPSNISTDSTTTTSTTSTAAATTKTNHTTSSSSSSSAAAAAAAGVPVVGPSSSLSSSSLKKMRIQEATINPLNIIPLKYSNIDNNYHLSVNYDDIHTSLKTLQVSLMFMPSCNHHESHHHHGDRSYDDDQSSNSNSSCDFKILFSINAYDILNEQIRDPNNNNFYNRRSSNNNNSYNNSDGNSSCGKSDKNENNIKRINSFCHRYQHQLICRNIFNHLKRDCMIACHEWDIITSNKILKHLLHQHHHHQDQPNHDHRNHHNNQKQQQQHQHQQQHHACKLDNNMRDTLLYEELSDSDNIIVITITHDTIILRVSQSLYLCYQLVDSNHLSHYHHHHHHVSHNSHDCNGDDVVNDNNNNTSNDSNKDNIVFHQSFIKILSSLFLYSHIHHDPNSITISNNSKKMSSLPIIISTNVTCNMIQKIFHLFCIHVHKFRINYYITSLNKQYINDRIDDQNNNDNDDNDDSYMNRSDDKKYYVKWSTKNNERTQSLNANTAHKLFSTFYYGTIYQRIGTKANSNNNDNNNNHKINVVDDDDNHNVSNDDGDDHIKDGDDDNDHKNKKKDKKQQLKVIIRLQFSISSSHFLHILKKIKMTEDFQQSKYNNIGLTTTSSSAVNVTTTSTNIVTTDAVTTDVASTTIDTNDIHEDAIIIDRLIHEVFYKSEDNIDDDDSISKYSYVTIKHIYNLHQFISYFKANVL